MYPELATTTCHCPCSANKFSVQGSPILRAICHCTICQEFNQADYADITLFKASDVVLSEDSSVEFKTYKSPPAVQRGKCPHCERPAIEFFRLPVMSDLAIVPSQNFPDVSLLPEVKLHMFYHSRQHDSDDDLPKYSGFLRSQMGFGRHLLGSLMRKA